MCIVVVAGDDAFLVYAESPSASRDLLGERNAQFLFLDTVVLR